MSVDMTNSATNGQAFTCTAGGHALVETAAASNAGQAFSAAYANLKVVIKGTTTVATSVSSATATTLTLVGTCPAGITATAGEVGIGQPGAIAPKPGNSFASLSAELNLNPVLVATQDDCNKNTFEGFQVIGTWNNPLSGAGTALGYTTTAVIGAPVVVSTGQVLFPTSVVSFAAYVAPKRTGTTLQTGQHFEYVFPSLPTTLAVCLSAGNPANPVAISFGLNPTVLSVGAGVPTGSGNPADPAIRALGVATGAQTGHYVLKNGTTTVVTGALPTCTIPSATTAPAFTCGDG
jgi:hypothetical protein